MQKSYLEPQNVIFSTGPVNQKIYIREQTGYFQRIRRGLNTLLISLFVLIPFIPYNNQQAVFFDVGAQKFHFFAFTLYPQDLGIFALLFILAAFGLFAITKVYGRVWCGFACPQTVWTLMFNWIERRIEGTNNQSKALDRQPWNFSKVAKKLSKHLAWMALSFLTALVFMSYFVPVDELYPALFSLQMSALVFGWVAFLQHVPTLTGGGSGKKCASTCVLILASRLRCLIKAPSWLLMSKSVESLVAPGDAINPNQKAKVIASIVICVYRFAPSGLISDKVCNTNVLTVACVWMRATTP